MEFRAFFIRFDVHPGATSSAYIETQQVDPKSKEQSSTKLQCAMFGPMQKQSDASGAGQEACSIKI